MHIIGSKWFKVDFHCHSPASDDFQEIGIKRNVAIVNG